jgi:hypothetical protein
LQAAARKDWDKVLCLLVAAEPTGFDAVPH